MGGCTLLSPHLFISSSSKLLKSVAYRELETVEIAETAWVFLFPVGVDEESVLVTAGGVIDGHRVVQADDEELEIQS